MFTGACAARMPVGTVMRGGDGRPWRAVRSTVRPKRIYWQLQTADTVGGLEAGGFERATSALELALARARAAGTARAALKRVDPILAAAADMLNISDAAALAQRRFAAAGGDGDCTYFSQGT